MIDLITQLGQLDFVMDSELSHDLILRSFLNFFSKFVINYHMNKLNISLLELLKMLKITKSHFQNEKALILLVDKLAMKMVGKKGSKKKKI